MRIAIVAHGRFHAFDLARELRALGHDVTLLSNYPAWVRSRFGLEQVDYRPLVAHGASERVLSRLVPARRQLFEQARHEWFGRWAARTLGGGHWDVVHCWSGVSEEILRSPELNGAVRVLMRGSAHIREQSELLEAEEQRLGMSIERPSPWMVAREEREYALADRIVVLSTFARTTFERRGVTASRLSVLPLGVDTAAFGVDAEVRERRAARVLEGRPLRVVYAGALSAQKGLLDLLEAARRCADLPIVFELVGAALPEMAGPLAARPGNVVVTGAVDQGALPAVYAAADLFVFPTIQDGFGMVLSQAAAAGLPILCSTNCAGPELIAAGAPGWVVPIRRPDLLADRLRWCHEHRPALAEMVRTTFVPHVRSWRDVAEDFAGHAREWVSAMRRERSA